jgi:cellulose/xylan binding protein with CBM9 domain
VEFGALGSRRRFDARPFDARRRISLIFSTVTIETLPRLWCRHRDPGAHGWEGIEPVFLRENVTGLAPEQPTWVKAAWDDARLHVLFHCEDNDAWATLTGHDAPLYNEEVVEVFFDPTGDLACYFEIEVNPLNATLDVVLRRNRSGWRKDFDWHCEGLQTAVTKTTCGWDAEIAIPFDSLEPGMGGEGKTWRANFYRIDRPKNAPRELSAWSPTRCGTFHVPQRFGLLEFIRTA